MLLVLLLRIVLYYTFTLQKKGNEGPTTPAPSAPPLPTLRAAFFENNNASGQNRPESPTVNFHLDPQTGYLHEDQPWEPEVGPEYHHGNVNDKPNGIRERLRHWRKG